MTTKLFKNTKDTPWLIRTLVLLPLPQGIDIIRDNETLVVVPKEQEEGEAGGVGAAAAAEATPAKKRAKTSPAGEKRRTGVTGHHH